MCWSVKWLFAPQDKLRVSRFDDLLYELIVLGLPMLRFLSFGILAIFVDLRLALFVPPSRVLHHFLSPPIHLLRTQLPGEQNRHKG